MVVDPSQDELTRTRWLAVLAGPLAWALDEGIALVIDADVCATNARHVPALTQVILIALAVLALAVMLAGATSAWRMYRSVDEGAGSIRAERTRFMALGALLLATVSAYGVGLRLLASLAGGLCG
jgi:hypothetical protein